MGPKTKNCIQTMTVLSITAVIYRTRILMSTLASVTMTKCALHQDNESGPLDTSSFEAEPYVSDYITDSCLVLILSNTNIHLSIQKRLMCKMRINFSDIFRMNKTSCIICWANTITYSQKALKTFDLVCYYTVTLMFDVSLVIESIYVGTIHCTCIYSLNAESD